VSWLGHLDAEKFLLFTLVFTRISGLTMIAPIYGTREVPTHVRVLLAFALALLITPTQWHVAVAMPQGMLLYLLFVAAELLVGLCLGLAVVILLSGMELAGEMIGYVSGLMLADVFDPSMESNVPLFSRLLFLVATAVFVCIGGHRIVMAGLLDTFQTIPPGSGALPDSVAGALVVLVTQSFGLAVRAAMPVVAALLLANLVLGLISRTLPQLNVLMLGFGLNAMLTFAVLSLTLGAAAWVFQDQLQPTLEVILDALQAPLQSQWLA
jgi:flagellar biosynthetic protein FliR